MVKVAGQKSGRGGHCNTGIVPTEGHNFAFTLYLPLKDREVIPWEGPWTYIISNPEICPTSGRDHWQSACRFKSTKTLSAGTKVIQAHFGVRCHVELMYKPLLANIRYCSKEESKSGFETVERGERPSPGKRSDLDALAADLQARTSTVNEIILEEPMAFHMYGRTLQAIEDLVLQRRFRTEFTQGMWYYGETGVGKSHKAFEGYTNETHYVHCLADKGWWDGYKQQDTVIINEFRGQIEYGHLMDLVDMFPMTVPRRNRGPIPFISKTMIITTSLSPEEVYWRRNAEDHIEQLYRRFRVIRMHYDCTIENSVITEIPWRSSPPSPEAQAASLRSRLLKPPINLCD